MSYGNGLLLCGPRICNAIIKSHPQRGDVHKADLDKNLPSIQQVNNSLVRLRHICVIGENRVCVCVCVWLSVRAVLTPVC